MENRLFKPSNVMQQAESTASIRLWGVFLSARIALALVLTSIQVLLHSFVLNAEDPRANWLITRLLLAYLAETIILRLLLNSSQWLHKQHQFWLWIFSAGIDLAVFSWLYWSSSSDIGSYLSLLMFCILLVASLGPRWLIYSVCLYSVGFVMLRSGIVWGDGIQHQSVILEMRPVLLTSLGLFAFGELIFQLANRMRKEEYRAFEGISSAKQQEILNRMIVAEMGMGVVVANHDAQLKMVNPAAATLITGILDLPDMAELPNILSEAHGWKQLQEVVKTLYESEVGNRWLVFDLMLEHDSSTRSGRLLQIKGRLLETGSLGNAPRLCLLFLSDMREVDRRMQQEKLAAMGRMSASIAHEIRNPLATISSANTLLSEGLHDKASLRLTKMISTNVQRLTRVVKDVLDVAHMQESGEVEAIDLLFVLPDIVADWAQTHQQMHRITIQWPDDIFGVFIAFDEDHLRRVLVNLLDNAARYAGQEQDSILVVCQVYDASENEMVRVSVYSDGEPLKETTEQSLFEPFFSTEAQGTGLGLYICRSLCNRYGASLDYQRTDVKGPQEIRAYNEFYLTASRVDPLPGETRVLIEQTRYQ